MSYTTDERMRASRWKAATPCLPDAARVAAPYAGLSGGTAAYDFCLPAEVAAHNLLPDVREDALRLFAELGIPWHAGVGGGPTNHLLSSQVQCVNALAAMVRDPVRIQRAFHGPIDVAEVLEIEDGRFLTFEYIGPRDLLGEAVGDRRTRGANCTSVDAAFCYRRSDGKSELALVEWKYTESYPRARKVDPAKDAVRAQRYERFYEDPDGPLLPLVPFELMQDEPFYQLMRQLLAWRIEAEGELGFDRVRVLHVLSPANDAYQRSIVRPEMKEYGATVDEIWSLLLRRPSSFVHVDPSVFIDPAVTSPDYVARYGGELTST